jgi:twitching motility protein PilU
VFKLKPYLKLMADKKASDLFFTPMAPIKIKIEGQIVPVGKDMLTVEVVNQIAMSIMNEEQQKRAFERELELDFAISETGLGRFRANVFRQRGNIAVVLRYITHRHAAARRPRPAEGAQGAVAEEARPDPDGRRDRLGQVDHARRDDQSSQRAVQRPHHHHRGPDRVPAPEQEVDRQPARARLGHHSYARALKSAMRAAPDVVLIGEIRDQETMEAAIMLAGTGHLAIATLHANNAAETLDRIINMFPQGQHRQVLMDMSHYLRRSSRSGWSSARTGGGWRRSRCCSTRRTSPS